LQHVDVHAAGVTGTRLGKGDVCTANTATRRGSSAAETRRFPLRSDGRTLSSLQDGVTSRGRARVHSCVRDALFALSRRLGGNLSQPGVQCPGAAHRAQRIGIKPTERHNPRPGLLHPVTEDGDAKVARRQYGASDERRLDLLHSLGVFRECLATDHQLIGIKQVTQQGDRLTKHPGPLGQ
jgi:hypothetical protein